jgi:hypothetical protein
LEDFGFRFEIFFIFCLFVDGEIPCLFGCKLVKAFFIMVVEVSLEVGNGTISNGLFMPFGYSSGKDSCVFIDLESGADGFVFSDGASFCQCKFVTFFDSIPKDFNLIVGIPSFIKSSLVGIDFIGSEGATSGFQKSH